MLSRENIMAAAEHLDRLVKLGRKRQGMRATTMRVYIEEHLPILKMQRDKKHLINDAMALNRLIGIAIGIGAISKAQSTLIDEKLLGETKKAGN